MGAAVAVAVEWDTGVARGASKVGVFDGTAQQV